MINKFDPRSSQQCQHNNCNGSLATFCNNKMKTNIAKQQCTNCGLSCRRGDQNGTHRELACVDIPSNLNQHGKNTLRQNTFKLIKPTQGWWNKIQHIVHHDWSHRTIFYVFVQDFNKKHHLGRIELAKDLQGPF